ncbi:MAG: methyl-accepting chemotaxis protein [Deltaproteobacteria bacterium]|nr:methyl-accepting chemotaxis protein [Deltaproteobacteria bacterium]
MFKNLRLTYRILLGYSIPILLSAAVAAAVYSSVRTVERESSLAEASHSTVYNLNKLELNGSNMQRDARGYYLSKDESHLKAFGEAEEGFKESAGTLKQLMGDEKGSEILKRAVETGNGVTGEAQLLISLVKGGKEAEAIKRFKGGEPTRRFREFAGVVRELEKLEDATLAGRKETVDAALKFLTGVVVFGTLLSIVVAVTAGIMVASRISRKVTETVNAIATSSNEMASTVAEHEKTVNQQSAMINETTATVEELGSSSRQSAEQATQASTVAEKATSSTEEGKGAVNEAIAAMSALKDKIDVVADHILKLGEKTDRIGNIANLVKDIAGQTNMLALNAAVEAARAGEHGKGFAIVASEVRKLADQSKKSADEANAIIAEIQKATNSAIMVTEQGTKSVEDVTGLAGKVGGLFDTLSAAAKAVYENAQQVLLNTKQQAAALAQVVSAINTINTASKETAAGITQTKIGIQRLNEAAHELKAVV